LPIQTLTDLLSGLTQNFTILMRNLEAPFTTRKPPPAPGTPILGRQPTVVLVIEDDFLVRMNAAQAIEEAGFEAIESANADQAIAILEARPDIIIVFADIQMPGDMDGLKLAAAIRDRWPPIKIVATSGARQHQNGRSAGRRALSAEALQPSANCRDAARADRMKNWSSGLLL
jgi:CheY-like chemotaxis protein